MILLNAVHGRGLVDTPSSRLSSWYGGTEETRTVMDFGLLYSALSTVREVGYNWSWSTRLMDQLVQFLQALMKLDYGKGPILYDRACFLKNVNVYSVHYQHHTLRLGNALEVLIKIGQSRARWLQLWRIGAGCKIFFIGTLVGHNIFSAWVAVSELDRVKEENSCNLYKLWNIYSKALVL